LSEDTTLRAEFEIEHGRVIKFMVQLECRFTEGDEWSPVVRYDTAHGFAHCDKIHPYKETTKIEMKTSDYNEALNTAMKDVVENWADYRRSYEEWLKQK